MDDAPSISESQALERDVTVVFLTFTRCSKNQLVRVLCLSRLNNLRQSQGPITSCDLLLVATECLFLRSSSAQMDLYSHLLVCRTLHFVLLRRLNCSGGKARTSSSNSGMVLLGSLSTLSRDILKVSRISPGLAMANT